MLRLAQLGILLLCAGSALSQGQDCDELTYMTCQQKMNDALGLTNPQPWFAPEEFRNQVEDFYMNQGETGLRTVCKAFREFKVCMGDQYRNCINPGFFVLSTVSPYDAYQFVSTFNTMHFTCGAGLQIYTTNEQCMSNAWTGSNANNFYACRTKFERTSDVQTDNACSLGNTYIKCYEDNFATFCGKPARDTQFWGCEYARVNIFTRFPNCNTKCVLPYNGIF